MCAESTEGQRPAPYIIMRGRRAGAEATDTSHEPYALVCTINKLTDHNPIHILLIKLKPVIETQIVTIAVHCYLSFTFTT